MKKKQHQNIYPKAHVDLESGKIHGCPKGSWKWYHEKGHIVFNDSDKGSWLLMLKSYVFDFWMFFVTACLIFKELKFPVLIIFVVSFCMDLYEESWCNGYADKYYRGKK